MVNAMSALLAPTRFQIDRAELASALAGTVGAASADPQRAAALRVLADPDHLVVVLANRAGSPLWSATRFVVGKGDAGVVARADASDGTDAASAVELVLLPSPALAAVAIDDLVGLTEVVALSGSTLELSLAGYAAVLACADALQAATLRARAARQPLATFPVTAELLEAQLRQGLAASDTRWAVTAAQPITPGDLGTATGSLAAGLGELQQEGLVTPAAHGFELTRDGVLLASMFGSLIVTAQLALVAAAGMMEPLVAPLGIFRASTAIWLAAWSDGGSSARVTLIPATIGGALSVVERLVAPLDAAGVAAATRGAGAGRAPAATAQPTQPAPARPADAGAPAPSAHPRFCGSCGAPVRDGAVFCGTCGTKVGVA